TGAIPLRGVFNPPGPGFSERKHTPGNSAGEHEKKPDHDEVVRRVRQRPGIAACANMPADVPNEPEQRADDGRDEHGYRQRDPRWSLEAMAKSVGKACQPRDAAHSVQIADPNHGSQDDHRNNAQADDLVDWAAAARAGRSNDGNVHWLSSRLMPPATGDGIPRVPGFQTRLLN